MNKVVKHHVPVERLPEELRRGFAAGEIVEVEVRGPASDADERAPAAPEDEGEALTLESWRRQHWAEHGEPPPLPPEEVERRGRLFDRFFGSHAHLNTSIEEAVVRIRALRDEDD
ncbi:hypothetical protein [Salinarimonas sp.]|uniref:hypothetical protein n=1 Tax=Salinarimonas sp. TaxID=2766526 RepID=UPI0032D91F74